ncbi:substrate-binding domain-containing protein [Leucobacter sp. gxy201]|uniref:LacI family DNA-binding transcriptional regulator n=1 Tax=Leucobacter sp. gxy201 TaxID=2957200 RepID=UPI003D9FFE94
MSPRGPQHHRPANQADVARLAGVSTQTVSRVVSGQSSVRPDTAARVQAAIEQLGYRVQAVAASLASGRTRLLGVMIVSNDRYSLSALGVGVEQTAAGLGYTVTTAAVAEHASIDAFLQAFDRLERQGAEGIVLAVPIDLDSPEMRLRTHRTPTVRSDRAALDPRSPFAVDQALISRLAVDHLLDLGHANVWHVSGDEYWVETEVRRASWRESLEARGIVPPEAIPGDWTPESGYRAGRILAGIPEATAVYVSSDEMAFGVLRALHEAGRRVPEDVSVVSVDGIPLGAYATPALTTVRQPFEDLGRAAALRLIAQIEGGPVGALPATLPELVQRSSTAPPRAR